MVTDELVLVDQHCHGVVAGDVGVEGWLTEGVAREPFESMLGLAVRRWCGPVLGLPALASKEEYLARRGELGWRVVTERLLGAAGVGNWLVDTGFVPEGEALVGPGELGVGREREVVRVEQVTEGVVGGQDAAGLLGAIREGLWGRAENAVGLKTIVGYRWGLGVPEQQPDDDAARRAGERWLRSGDPRLAEPELLWWLVHEAARVGIEQGLPLQVHTGFGDADLRLNNVDPALLHGFVRQYPELTVVLLHCWPYQRNAAYLAHVFPNVIVDIGLMMPFVGARAGEVLAEVLELAPFGSVVYSSDGRALPETHYLGAKLFRHHCGRLLDGWIAEGIMTAADAERLVYGIGAGNAARIYQLT
jgi:hypothetical protein